MSKLISFSNKRKRVRFIIFSLLAVLVMLGIFLFSSQSADESSATSGKVINLVFKIFYSGYEDIAPIEQAELVSSYQGLIRAAAHGTIYLVLGFLLQGAVLQLEWKKPFPKAFCTLFVVVLYAISDEIHQYFVPGRAFQLIDLGVDTLGAAVGILLFLTLLWVYKRIAKRPCK